MIDEKFVEEMIQQELKEANKSHPMFHSDHEAYAVIKEEIEEASFEFVSLENYLGNLWHKVVEDEPNKKRIYDEMKKASIRAIQEAIQVAAMCDKAIASIEWRRGGR